MAATFVHFDSVKLRLVRSEFTRESVKGSLYLGDLHLCDTLENYSKSIDQGEYIVRFALTPSWSRFYNHEDYLFQLRLLDKNGRKGILFHIGNTPSDSDGCILVGVDSGSRDFISYSRCTYGHLCEFFEAISKLHGVGLTSPSQYISFDLVVEVK